MKRLVVAVVAVLALVGTGSVLAFAAQQPARSSHPTAAVQSNGGHDEQGTANGSQVCDNDNNDNDNDNNDNDEDAQEQDEENQSEVSEHEQGCQD